MSASTPGSTQGQFVTQMQPEQMMASKLIGTTVVGANNESIGDINDVIVDRKGQAMAVVIGVGGFLGIGEKDVAVSFQQLDFTASPQSNQQTSGTTTGGTAPSGSSNTVSTTGSTAGTSGTSGASNRAGGVPDRVVLRMTKAELQAAPTFATSNRDQNSGNAGGTTAPKQ
jgi:sporulation protein YlmC with PRC-barrel domain